MAATPDEIAWAMTFNILATAVVTPMTGWLVARFGRRNVMVGSILAFSVATYFCGDADSLEALVFWRILQGGAGAPVVPLSNAIVLDSFPAAADRPGQLDLRHGGGDRPGDRPDARRLSRRRIQLALGVLHAGAGRAGVRGRAAADLAGATGRRRAVRLDWIGFLTLAAAMSCVQLVLSRGQRLDWFESGEIVLETIGAGAAFYLFLAHSLTARRPFLNLRLLLDRNYALGLVLVTIYGMLNFTPMVLLPPLLQQHAGYPDNIIGEILGMRGIGATIGFFLAMFVGRLDPRIGMTIGFGLRRSPGCG